MEDMKTVRGYAKKVDKKTSRNKPINRLIIKIKSSYIEVYRYLNGQ